MCGSLSRGSLCGLPQYAAWYQIRPSARTRKVEAKCGHLHISALGTKSLSVVGNGGQAGTVVCGTLCSLKDHVDQGSVFDSPAWLPASVGAFVLALFTECPPNTYPHRYVWRTESPGQALSPTLGSGSLCLLISAKWRAASVVWLLPVNEDAP